MAEMLYYPEVWASHALPVDGSVWQWYRTREYRELVDEVPFDLETTQLDYVFCLREIVAGSCVFEKDFRLSEFVPGIQNNFPESTSLGTKNMSYAPPSALELSHRLPAIIAGDAIIFRPLPEAQLLAVAIRNGDGYIKGQELWRKDQRHPRYHDTVYTWELLGVDVAGLVVAAFRHALYEDGEQRQITWSDDWGDDGAYLVQAVRRPVAGPHGSRPAGIAWIHPITGEIVAEHYYEPRELEAPRYKRGYLYDSITWTPGDTPPVSVAEVPRPFGSIVTGYDVVPGGFKYYWSDDGEGHSKWTQCSFRFHASGGITEWSSVGASSDYQNPFGFANGTAGTRKVIEEPGLVYYAAASQLVEYRWIGRTDELDPTRLTGGEPPHSVSSCCLVGGLVIFGPSSTGIYQYRTLPGGGLEEVEVYDPRRFVWSAYRQVDGVAEKVWETSLGGAPGEPELDTQRYRTCSTPLVADDRVYTVIHDYISSGSSGATRGPVRLVVLRADTGEVISDTPIDKGVFGGSDEQNSLVEEVAEIHDGRLHVRINGLQVIL